MHGLEDDDTVVTVVLCPECAEREFGPPAAQTGD